MAKLDIRDKEKLLQTMLRSRLGDLREQSLIRQGKGWFHVSGMGHEALSVAGYLLQKGDIFAGYYRDRPIAVARGMTTQDLALAFFAKANSASGGRQMPAHYSSKEMGIFSIASVVGASLLPAAGFAWSQKLDGTPNLVLTTVGDAGTRQGDFFEAVAIALEHQLPMVFLVEDNGIGISTFTEKMHPLGLEMLNTEQWQMVDGCDVDSVFEAVQPAMEGARSGKGPYFLWCRTERISSHSSADDHRKYRSPEELKALEEKDPVNRLKNDLIAQGALTESAFSDLRDRLEEEVRQEYARAAEEHDPRAEDLLKHVHGPTTSAPALRLELEKTDSVRMVDTINATFHAALRDREDTVFFGQDIADPKGGVFSLTKGLSTRAPARVKNSPLAESTIFGVSVGMAAHGKRPVFEIQFADYIWPGFNQLVTHLSTLHWRTNGEWTAPAVIYAPYGAYLPGGALWHSQANEAALAHFPGLNIAIPSTPEDAAGLFWSAIHGNSPTLILVPKHLMWHAHETALPIASVPFGKARIRKSGEALSVVTWGNGNEVVEEAIALLGNPDAIEWIDLRSIAPLDLATLRTSLARTGRLLVVQEDAESCSVGQNVISRLVSDPELFSQLQAPPTLIAKPDVHIGYNPVLEYAALPDAKTVARKMQELLTLEWARSAPAATAAQPMENPVLEQMQRSLTDKGQDGETSIEAIKVPILGEGITHARVIALLAQPGDAIDPDDPLCEVETDKALFPIESPSEGQLKSWKIKEGDDVEVGQLIAELAVGEPTPQARPEAAPPATPPPPAPVEAPAAVQFGGLPPHILARLHSVVPAYLTVQAGWKPIREARQQAKAAGMNPAPSPTTMVAWCLVQTMKEHPVFRCTITLAESLQQNDVFDFGVAVAMEKDALDTAIIPRASELEGPAFLEAYSEAVTTARAGTQRSKVSTPLILTSMGRFAVRDAQPLVVPPAIATLFLGEAHLELDNDGSQVEKVALCLSFDHRWLNGAACAQFLHALRDKMEAFSLEDFSS
jgi:2-oxoisovalerate dehydrogenase E1 component